MAGEGKGRQGISRRDFARVAATAAAAGALAPAAAASAIKPSEEQAAQGPQLTGASRDEAEARYAELIRRWGSRLSAEQKTDVHRLVMAQQKTLETVRGFALTNANEPALILHPRIPGEEKAE